MEYEEAMDVLTRFNLWRRNEHIPNKYDMPAPKEIGIAIDTAIEALKYKSEEITKFPLRRACEHLMNAIQVVDEEKMDDAVEKAKYALDFLQIWIETFDCRSVEINENKLAITQNEKIEAWVKEKIKKGIRADAVKRWSSERQKALEALIERGIAERVRIEGTRYYKVRLKA